MDEALLEVGVGGGIALNKRGLQITASPLP
jgi:hypothetical protein